MDFWIKSIGAARAPLRDEWLREEIADGGALASSPRLAERVHFPRNKRPVGIGIGDYFLLYGVTERGGRIIGAGIFKSTFYEEDRSEELQLRTEEDIAAWPWRIDIEMLISVWHAHRGPTIGAIGVDPVKMRRRSHLRLTEEQYLAGIEALAGVGRPAFADG
jgi:hypothetical protein